jgi:hypothetical protein
LSTTPAKYFVKYPKTQQATHQGKKPSALAFRIRRRFRQLAQSVAVPSAHKSKLMASRFVRGVAQKARDLKPPASHVVQVALDLGIQVGTVPDNPNKARMEIVAVMVKANKKSLVHSATSLDEKTTTPLNSLGTK